MTVYNYSVQLQWQCGGVSNHMILSSELIRQIVSYGSSGDIATFPNSIVVRKLLRGEHSLENWHVGSETVPASRGVHAKKRRCSAECPAGVLRA